MKEADPSHQLARLAQDSVELVAEYTAATEEHDRRIALIQLRAIDAERTRIQHQIEALDGLPDRWESLFSAVDGIWLCSLVCAPTNDCSTHRRGTSPTRTEPTMPRRG